MNLTAMIPAGPYAIEPSHGQRLWQMFQGIDLHVHLSEFEQSKAQAAGGPSRDAPRKPYPVDGGVAILSLSGPMTKDGGSSFDGGGTSTSRLRRQVRQASADPDVTAILLRVDSPGGEVAGTPDLARDVSSAAQKKPLFAYIEDLGASAAYWVASQANAIYANPTALVGSIGTYMVVQDSAGMADQLGVKVHVLKDGDHKGAGVPGSPVTDEHLAHYQGIVHDLNSHFIGAVNRSRGMSLTRNAAPANGQVFVGAKAREQGLVDGITSFDTVLAKLKSFKPNQSAK